MALNACELEIDLFCRGIRIPGDIPLDGARGISRTRAGLGSGLEIVIPGGSWMKDRIWVNVPVQESFAQQSPYVLEGSPRDGYRVRDERSQTRYDIEIPPEPVWYARTTTRGIPMNRVGVLQGTYLGIYINNVCAFWNYSPSLNCRFCTTGTNVGEHEVVDKAVEDVVEVARAAREESGVTFVHLNAGFQGSRGVQFAEPYITALKERVGTLVGAQLAPQKDRSQYDRLIGLGVDHLSFCLEFIDPAWFAKLCPGKERVLGQQVFFDAIEYCARQMPKGAVSGEIIAGVEPIEQTLKGIDWIADHGAFPTVCIFRPTVGSDMETWASPGYEDMRRVMEHMYQACRRNWIPIGAAPNIEVSIVVNPDDAAMLAPRTAGFFAFEAFRRAIRVAARPAFARRMRPGPRRDPGGDGEIPQGSSKPQPSGDAAHE
ncbi:MAG TPA: radical SAM protein [Vicinamibacterales bacterium]|jgi:hypothetical protein